jgi:hypothetical protein
MISRIPLLLFLLVTECLTGLAAVLPFQGVLTTPEMEIVEDGLHTVRFRLFDAPLGGEVVWSGEMHRLSVRRGLVNVVLGSVMPIDVGVEVFQGGKVIPMYLEITVDSDGGGTITESDPPLLPRQAVVPNLFAELSRDSRKLEGWGWDRILDPNGGVHWNALGESVAGRIQALEAEIALLKSELREPLEEIVPSVLYVDPVSGDNANNGSSEAPLRTLGAAIGKLPSMLPSNVTIFLEKGDYEQATLIDGLNTRYGQSLRIESTAKLPNGGFEPGGVTFSGGAKITISGSTNVQFFGITFQPDSGFAVFVPFRSTVSFTSCQFNSQSGLSVRRWSHAFVADCVFDGSKNRGWRGIELESFASVVMHEGTKIHGYETAIFADTHSAALWATTRPVITEYVHESQLFTGSIFSGARE